MGKSENRDIVLILFFLLLSQILTIENKKKKLGGIMPDLQINLTVYDYGKNRSSYKLHQINDANINEGKSCKLSYLKEKNLSLIEKYSQYYNRKWLFFTENKEIITFLLEEYEKILKKTKPLYLMLGIIFPETIEYKLNKSTSVPLYNIEEQYTKDFISFDILNQTMNTYFIITQYSIEYEYPFKYLFITSSLTFFFSLFILIYWNYRLKRSRDVITLQKFLMFLPYLNLILSFLIGLEAYSLIGQNPNDDYDSSIYLETALFTVNAIFRAVLWIFFVLVAAGWQIAKHSFSSEEIKHFIKIFVFIYLMMCIDQIIDSFNTAKTIFKANEIKNFIFYIFIMVYVAYKGIKTINFLKRKLQYSAMFHTLQYIPGLKLKIKMMKNLISIIFIFSGLFIITCLIHKFFFIIYDTQKFEIIQYHYLDLIFMTLFLYIFRPMRLPEFFDVDYGEDINENGKIFKCKIKKLEEFNNLTIPNPKIKSSDAKVYMNENIPVVVIHPCFGKKINGNNIDTIISNAYLGYFNEN